MVDQPDVGEACTQTAGELLRLVAARLASSEFVTQPEDEARWIVAHVLGQRSGQLAVHSVQSISLEQSARALSLTRRRCAGEPLQYVLGTCEFYGREFRCDSRALIPRPETEGLVELALRLLRDVPKPRVADIGTGCGCIAITVALERPDATVVATEASAVALSLAQENAAVHGLSPPRLTLASGDLFQALEGRFDALLCNPPYVPTGTLAQLGVEVAHEPRVALDGGLDGLDVIRRIAGAWRNYLTWGGFLLLEVGHDQAERVTQLFAPALCEVHADMFGANRYVLAR